MPRSRRANGEIQFHEPYGLAFSFIPQNEISANHSQKSRVGNLIHGFMAFQGCSVGGVITLVVHGLRRRYTITLIYSSVDRSLAELRLIWKTSNPQIYYGTEPVHVLECFT